MSRNAYSGGRHAYALRRAGANECVEILNENNELVIPSFMQDGIYPYCLSDLFLLIEFCGTYSGFSYSPSTFPPYLTLSHPKYLDDMNIFRCHV